MVFLRHHLMSVRLIIMNSMLIPMNYLIFHEMMMLRLVLCIKEKERKHVKNMLRV